MCSLPSVVQPVTAAPPTNNAVLCCRADCYESLIDGFQSRADGRVGQCGAGFVVQWRKLVFRQDYQVDAFMGQLLFNLIQEIRGRLFRRGGACSAAHVRVVRLDQHDLRSGLLRRRLQPPDSIGRDGEHDECDNAAWQRQSLRVAIN